MMWVGAGGETTNGDSNVACNCELGLASIVDVVVVYHLMNNSDCAHSQSEHPPKLASPKRLTNTNKNIKLAPCVIILVYQSIRI